MKTLRTENNAGSMQLSRKPRAIAHRNFLQRLASFAIPKQARSESRAARNCARSRRRAIAQPIEGNQLYPRIKLNFGHFCRFFIDTRDRSRARTYVRTWVYRARGYSRFPSIALIKLSYSSWLSIIDASVVDDLTNTLIQGVPGNTRVYNNKATRGGDSWYRN